MALFDSQKNYSTEEGSRTLLTISGDSAVIEGKFKVSKSIEIDCDIKGQLDIEGEMVIQKNGHVSADVKTLDAEIIGRYEGSLEASGNVEIKETGIVNGNIKTDSLIINKGGIFSGNVTRISETIEPSKKKIKATSNYKDLVPLEKDGKDLSEVLDASDLSSESDSNLSL